MGEPACEVAWALDHQDIVGYGHIEVNTGRAGFRGPPFEDGSDALANGSVRPGLFPRTKQSPACGQLEANWKQIMTGAVRPTLSSFSGTPQPPPQILASLTALCGSAFESVQEFRGLPGLCITFTALLPLLILPSFGGKNVVAQLPQTTCSVVNTVINEGEREGERKEMIVEAVWRDGQSHGLTTS